jgi:hypothetical protein
MSDIAIGHAVLWRKLGLLSICYARTETKQWEVITISVQIAGADRAPIEHKAWMAEEVGNVLNLSPSLVVVAPTAMSPSWHNTYNWAVRFIEGDALPLDPDSRGMFDDVCRAINERAMQAWVNGPDALPL